MKEFETLSKLDSVAKRQQSSSKNLKQYENLAKDNVPVVPSDAGPGRRPRSLSRTRLDDEAAKSGGSGSLKSQLSGSPNARPSRSLSRSHSKKSGDQAGIGKYIQRKQTGQKAKKEDDTKSTGTSSTGTNEISYATPSWMWHNSAAGSTSCFGSKDAFADFSANSFSGASFGSHSYDATAEVGTPKSQASNSTWGTPATAATSGTGSDGSNVNTPPPVSAAGNGASGNNISPPLVDSMNNSVSSLPANATPCTKAKHFFGKAMKEEQEQLLIQSQQLFQNQNAAPQPAVPPSMFDPME
eukprot:Sro1649_g288590.1 n/a (298) ;mRNA; f:13860-14753